MHIPYSILLTLTLPSLAHALCTAETRLAGAKQLIYAYNLVAPGESAAAFKPVPFADDCVITIAADGLPPVIVAVGGQAAHDFALLTRQVFSKVTGEYVDFAANGTTDIITNVTLGILHDVTVPVTFFANVYLDYNENCTIDTARAFAVVPTNILNLLYTHLNLNVPLLDGVEI